MQVTVQKQGKMCIYEELWHARAVQEKLCAMIQT